MSELLTRPLLRRAEPTWGTRVPWLAAVLASAWTLLASVALSVLPAVAVWISDGADTPLADPLRFGGRVWLLSHRIGLDMDGAEIVFAPLGMTLLIVLLMHRSARWAAHQAGTATPRGMAAVVVAAALVYAVGAGVLAAMSSADGVASSPLTAAGVAGCWAVLGFSVGVLHETGFDEVWFARLAPEVRAALVGGSAALGALMVVGAVLVTISTVANAGQVGALVDALDAGVLGNAVLLVGSAAILPNALVWASSFALGPGFAVGQETLVTPGGVDLGMVPAVPVMGVLPSEVPGPLTWLVLLGPVAAGVLAGVLVHRRLAPDQESPSTVVLAAGGAGAAAALAMSVLAMLSGGSLGAVRLSELGPVPWEVAAMTFVAVCVPAIVTVVLLQLRRARTGESETDEQVT